VQSRAHEVDVHLSDYAVTLERVDAEEGGYVEAAGRLLLFVKLVSPAWYYVAEFERKPYLSGKLPAGSDALASL
jgi:hypothetical protein